MSVFRFEPSQPSPFAKFFTWLLMCVIAWTSVLSGYSSASVRVADDLSTKVTKDHEVAELGVQGGDSGFANDDYEHAAFAHLSGGSEQAIEAVTYTYDEQCEHARSKAMGETLHPCCNGDSCRLNSELSVVSLQSFAAVSVNGASSCDYDESRGLLERNVHAGDFEMSFYSYDGLGSVRGLTDAIGTSLGNYHYDAYGLLIENTVSVANPYQFAGERFDNNLGLYYLRARFLSVETGRFHTMDSYEGSKRNAVTLHKYLYTGGNPVSNVDPSGHVSLSAHLAAGLNIAARFGGRIFTLANFGLRVAGIIDTTYMMYDIIRALQSGAVQKYLSSFDDLVKSKAATTGDYGLRKLLAMDLDHYVGIFSNVGRRLSSIIRLINKHHSKAIQRAARKPGKARFVIYLPSLTGSPGVKFNSKNDKTIPLQMPLRVWKFKVKLVASPIGGRLLGFGISGGGKTTQLMRIDYHGRKKGNHSAPYTRYFQAGSQILGETFRPWFHYHVQK